MINSAGTKKLVLSPDTDVYHIDLPIIASTHIECVVRLSSFNSLEHRFLDIQALLAAFQNDPRLAAVDQVSLPSVMQMLYLCTGCDFISFFNGFGKATFMATLLEYADFICFSLEHYQTQTLTHKGFYRSLGWLDVHILENTKQCCCRLFPHQQPCLTH